MSSELLIVAAFLLGSGALCVFLLYAVLRSVVTRVTLEPHQRLTLERPGRYILWFDKPRFSAFSIKAAGQPFPITSQVVSCSLREAASGEDMSVVSCTGMVRVTGIARMRRPLWRVRIERPGVYDLYLPDLPMDDRRLACNIAFARPLLGPALVMAGCIAVAAALLGTGIALMAVQAEASLEAPVARELPSRMAACLEHGEGCSQLVHDVEQLCSEGYGWSCETLGALRQQGAGGAEDPSGAADAWRLACEAGRRQACRELATAYLEGRGVEVDLGRAADALRRACDLGSHLSCEALGQLPLGAPTARRWASPPGRGRARPATDGSASLRGGGPHRPDG